MVVGAKSDGGGGEGPRRPKSPPKRTVTSSPQKRRGGRRLIPALAEEKRRKSSPQKKGGDVASPPPSLQNRGDDVAPGIGGWRLSPAAFAASHPLPKLGLTFRIGRSQGPIEGKAHEAQKL
ncbi:hypothetical protein Salat_2655600 [Sesamum alatum]|uniref:Uncharacterized protein n=1 Tax=Sesamum alatum TaxID=300844 RepID=A0AAE1XQ11_9LAMI|nr:hypothetical protein Salat_2655600 [Sesamum alatum]